MRLKQKIWGSQGEKLAKRGIETTAVTQKVQQNYRDIACKANFSPPYLRQAAKIFVSTSYSVVRQETIEISEQRTAFVWFFAQEVDWCMKDCDKQRLQTTINKPLKNLSWLDWRLIWRQNCFDMYHGDVGRSEKFHFDQFEI